MRRMRIDDIRTDLRQQAEARDIAAQEEALKRDIAMNKWGSKEEREQLHKSTLRMTAYQRRAIVVRVLHAVATAIGLVAIIGCVSNLFQLSSASGFSSKQTKHNTLWHAQAHGFHNFDKSFLPSPQPPPRLVRLPQVCNSDFNA
jgi:hypothetical protein